MQQIRNAIGLLLVCMFTLSSISGGQQEQRTRRSIRVVPMQEVQVVSPDGNVKFTLLPNAERMMFAVTLGGVNVLEPSPMVMCVDGYDLSSGVVFSRLERYVVNETYPFRGARSTATNRCNGARIVLHHDLTQWEFTLDVRVFDDGAAFRHIVPGNESASRVPDEYTTFVVPAGAVVWSHDMDGHYEAAYQRQEIAEVSAGQWAGPPVTIELPHGGGYASITEANLTQYSGMALESDGRCGWVIGLGHRQPLNYPFELRYGREEARRLGRPAAITGAITTPWRVVMVSRDLNTLVNSTLLPNLCPPPDPGLFPDGIRTSWLKAGRGVWRYVDGGDGSFEGLKEFSRMAGQLGFEHHVIEGIWSRWTTEQRKEIVTYSRAQGVGVWFWKHSRQLRTAKDQDEFFAMLHDLGVVGAKIDFFDHDAKEVVDLYDELLRNAAGHQIMLVFHGANKPTGRERTWPNEMVREAIRGMESKSMMERARHQTILPFTRYLAGPADYTTMLFSERRRDSSVPHQIATMVVYASPLLTIAAHPQSIMDNPASEVIKSIPPTWDETIVLPDSKIGECVVFARRTGDTWFLAIMNALTPRNLRIPLSFLGSGTYLTTLVRDDTLGSAGVRTESATNTAVDSLSIDLMNGGGFVARFSKR